MKELKSNKEKKKLPGQFKKARKRNLNIQHNRDQLKLLKEGKIAQAELFVLDPDAFKKVTIVPLNISLSEVNSLNGVKTVFLFKNGKKSRLRTGIIIEKNGVKIYEEPGGHVDFDHCFGIVIKEEILQKKK
jgi:hypothetical protein